MTHYRAAFILTLVVHFVLFSDGSEQTVTEDEGPVVTLTSGRVQGLRLVSAVNRPYFSFRGIPYAAPPVGTLRFKGPQPVTPWNGTLKAFKNQAACAQPWRSQAFPETFAEDCLYLNVYTPHIKPPRGEPMAVMFWIHGGKHYQGSGSSYKYGPDFLLPENVVLVNINYRLGVFGYLNMHTASALGNQSLKDMVAALRWVQREIHNFGGDPSRVTIVGGSTGGQDVHCLYISPMAQGLFHRAISHSTAPCGSKYTAEVVSNPGVRLAELLGCPVAGAEQTVECLRNITAEVLAEKQVEVIPLVPGPSSIPFGPSVEDDFGEEALLSISPQELAERSQSKVPYMMGLNDGEGKLDLKSPEDNPALLQEFADNFPVYVPNELREKANIKSIEEKIKLFYFHNESLANISYNDFMKFTADVRFMYPMVEMAKSLSTHTNVYFWYFIFHGRFKQHYNSDILNLTGANHGEELGYLFYRPDVIPEHTRLFEYPRECRMTTKMVRLWTNFAKYGVPTLYEKDGLLNVTWLPVNNTTSHLILNDSLTMVSEDLFPERIRLWESFSTLSLVQQDQIYVALYIIVFVLLLALISLLCIIHSIFCRQKYQEIL